MSQNLISLTLSADQMAAIDGVLGTLEQDLTGLLALDAQAHKGLNNMGDKSEAFAR